MFTTKVSALAEGTIFMCRENTHFYRVVKVKRGMKTVVTAENLSYATARIMAGDILVMPLYSLSA
jgi:hypothetical protein